MSTGRAAWLTAPKPPLDHMLCRALLAGGFARVVCVYGAAETTSVQRIEHVQCARADFSSYRSLRDLLSSQALRDVDTIVHVLSEEGDARAAIATRELLQLAEEQPGMQRFVLRSVARLYRTDSREPALIDEQHALDWARIPRALWAAAEADFTVCERIGSSRLQLLVLRCADVLSPLRDGALHAYLSSRVCLRPLGYDPMLNVLSLEDLARALSLAAVSGGSGIYNIPGRDTLPLSELIRAARRIDAPVPGPLLGPLYALRARLTRRRFDYLNDRVLFHYGAVVDGSKARRLLGYQPTSPISFDQLFAAETGGPHDRTTA